MNPRFLRALYFIYEFYRFCKSIHLNKIQITHIVESYMTIFKLTLLNISVGTLVCMRNNNSKSLYDPLTLWNIKQIFPNISLHTIQNIICTFLRILYFNFEFYRC